MENTKQNIEAVCILLINTKGEILAVSRKNDHNDFGLPGGSVDPGEHPEDAAIRELKEETGIFVEKSNLIKIYENKARTKVCATYLSFHYNEDNFLNITEEGVVKWTNYHEILKGSFSRYNEELLQKIFVILMNYGEYYESARKQ